MESIPELLEELRLNQVSLAEFLGVSKAAVSNALKSPRGLIDKHRQKIMLLIMNMSELEQAKMVMPKVAELINTNSSSTNTLRELSKKCTDELYRLETSKTEFEELLNASSFALNNFLYIKEYEKKMSKADLEWLAGRIYIEQNCIKSYRESLLSIEYKIAGLEAQQKWVADQQAMKKK